VIGAPGLGFGFAGHFVSLAEANLYNEDIVHAESSPYQRIVVTRWRDETRLYLNHNLQFSSRDEYRYHEALVHPGLAALPGARRVLVLGGGDGMAVREILKYPQVEQHHAGRPRSAHDRTVRAIAAAARAQRQLAGLAETEDRQCRRPAMAGSKRRRCSTSSSPISPIRPTTAWASSTRRPSTACSSSTSPKPA
jgi:hypothetical protein